MLLVNGFHDTKAVELRTADNLAEARDIAESMLDNGCPIVEIRTADAKYRLVAKMESEKCIA